MRGHIRERSPGHWAIVIDAQDAAGKRKRRWHSFKGTKREAQVRCAQLVTQAQQGGAIEPTKITVAQFIERFDRDWIATQVSARSAECYHGALNHVRRHLGDRRLQKVQSVDLDALYAALLGDGLDPRTIKLVHVVWHRALGQAKKWKIIRDNPAELAKPPKVPVRETDMLQPTDAARLLKQLRGKPLYLIASLGLATGMRRNEMLALRWRDLNLGAAQLTVAQALEQTKARGIRTKAPKTKHGRRTISLPVHIAAELRQHWRAQQEQRLALGHGRAADDDSVFATVDGQFLSPGAVSRAWIRAMESIGMPSVTLHSLRHTHASTLLNAGVDIITVSRRLGHSSPRITLDVYGHLIVGADDRAAEIAGAAFGNIG